MSTISSLSLSGKRWKTYELKTAETYQKRYTTLIKKLQKLNLDPIGFGEDYLALHLNGKKDWEDWKKLYPTIDVQVKAKILIKTPGNIY
ncbi:MAG TPA: Ger(x)C family spore germination C-terminal domain-containing protein [Bacillota bacterium]|nr:Ger(x)C family spore germination C-terminal domain-containing protein [Bacillota bacterium]